MRKSIGPININTKAKATKYFRGLNFTSISVSTGKSEAGRIRIRFRRVRFQTPSSVSFLDLAEFRVVSSVSSSQPIVWQNSPSLPQKPVRLSEFSSPKQYSRNSTPPVSYKNSPGSFTKSLSPMKMEPMDFSKSSTHLVCTLLKKGITTKAIDGESLEQESRSEYAQGCVNHDMHIVN